MKMPEIREYIHKEDPRRLIEIERIPYAGRELLLEHLIEAGEGVAPRVTVFGFIRSTYMEIRETQGGHFYQATDAEKVSREGNHIKEITALLRKKGQKGLISFSI